MRHKIKNLEDSLENFCNKCINKGVQNNDWPRPVKN